MGANSLITDTILTNLPTLLVLLAALFLLINRQGSKLFLIGLTLVFLSGVIALPVSSWLWANYRDFMSSSSLGTVLVVLGFGLLHSVALLCCVIAYWARGRDA